MKAKELREKSVEDLAELEKSLVRDAFQARFKNFTARLDDTSSLKKARRDVARVKTLLTERANIGEATASHAEAPKRSSEGGEAGRPQDEGGRDDREDGEDGEDQRREGERGEQMTEATQAASAENHTATATVARWSARSSATRWTRPSPSRS